MMEAAVNCLVNEARRKFVFASMGRRVRRSVTPYPRQKTGCPLRTTRTAAPGASLDFSDAKMASIRLVRTWAATTVETTTAHRKHAAASRGLKSLSSQHPDSRPDSTRKWRVGSVSVDPLQAAEGVSPAATSSG